jgi:hypothetical protein
MICLDVHVSTSIYIAGLKCIRVEIILSFTAIRSNTYRLR